MHAIKEYAPALYEQLRRFIMSELYTRNSFEAAVKARMEQYKASSETEGEFTYDEAVEEVIANSLENMLTKERVRNKLITEHRSLFARIWQAVKRFFEKLLGRDALKPGVFSKKTFESDTVMEATRRKERQLEELFVAALRSANEGSKALASAGYVSENGEKASFAEENSRKKITAEMSDSERYEALKNRTISLSAEANVKKLAIAQDKLDISDNDIEFSKYGDRVRLFKKLGKEFLVFRSYTNNDIKLNFDFSREKMRESVSKQQKKYMLLAKMLTCFDSVIENAVGIEVHNRNKDGYKKDDTLNNVYVLVSAFKDGENIVPAKLEVKEFLDKQNTLHVAIALESIKEDEIVKQEDTINGVARQYSPSSIISIANIFKKINPSDKSFLKYIPDGFLNEEQKAAKRDIRYSLSDTLQREALTEAFDNLAESDAEREVVRKYREEIDSSGEIIDELRGLKERYDSLAGKRGMAAERAEVNKKIKLLEDKLNRRDEQLLTLYNAKPLQDVVNRYRRAAFERRTQGDSESVTMSRGQFYKETAKYTHEKVYWKADARKALDSIGATYDVGTRTRDKLIDEIWQGLNGCNSEKERIEFIRSMSDKILDKIIDEVKTVNPDYDDANKLMLYLKDYIGRIAFSDDIKEEIKHKYDKDGTRSFLGRWGNKHSDKTPVNADVFVTSFARENPEYGYLEEYSTADALFEIDDIYDKVSATEKYIGAYDNLTNEEYAEMKSEIVDALLRAFKKGGVESIPARELTAARKHAEKMNAELDKAKRKFRDKYKETESFYKATLALDRIARSIRDKKLGTFDNATEIQGPALAGILRDLSRFEYRKTFSPNEVRAKVRELLEWYNKDNPMLGYESINETGDYVRGIRGMLEDLALKDGAFTAEELYELGNVLNYFLHFAEHYNKVFYNGKWEDAVAIAEKYIERMKLASGLKKNDTKRWSFIRFVRKYFDNYSDPLCVVRRYDAYQEDGFFTEMLRMLEKSAVGIATSEARVLNEYYDFLSENPDYLKTAQTEFVMIHGHRVPKLQAIALYMTTRQAHAQAGFVYNGFEYTNFAGQQVKVQDEAEHATIEMMRILRSKNIANERGISEDEAYKLTEDTEELYHGEKDYIEPEEIKAIAEAQRQEIAKSFTDNDKRLIDIVEKALSGELRKMKYDTDMQRQGFSNIFEGYYFPIYRTGIAKSVETQAYRDELVSVSNISANKERIKGSKQTLLILDVTKVLTRHARAICTYANMQNTVDFYDKIYNVDVSGNKNRAVNLKAAADGVWGVVKDAKGKTIEKGGNDYFKELIEDIQGLRHSRDSFINEIIAPLRSGMVVAALGLNAKVLFSQLSSYGAAMHILDFGSLARGIGKVAKRVQLGGAVLTKEGREALAEFGAEVDKYCELAKVRAAENHAYLAQGVIEKKDGSVKTSRAAEVLSKGQELVMTPIGMMDRAVICGLFEACQLQTASEGGAAWRQSAPR